MNALDCPRQEELLEAVASGRWPGVADRELDAHVAGCAICAEVAEVSRALLDDALAAGHDAGIPSAGLVWWRAELRLRSELTRDAMRPISAIQAIAAACAAGVGVALVGLALRWLPGWHEALDVIGRPLRDGAAVAGMMPVTVLVVALAAFVLAPVAVYLAMSDD